MERKKKLEEEYKQAKEAERKLPPLPPSPQRALESDSDLFSPLSAQRPEPTSLAGLEAAKSAETGQPATKPVRMKSFKVKETKFGCISKFFRLLAAWTMRMNNTIFLAS
jgi:hypothetical protein